MSDRRPVSSGAAGGEGRERPSSAYRIEHRCGDAAAVLGYTDDPLAQHSVLAPLAVRLVDAGATGALLLIEEASGDVLARRALHSSGDRARPARDAPVGDAAMLDG